MPRLRELRCPKCHGLLLKEAIVRGVIEIKCFNKDPATRKPCNEMVKAQYKDWRDVPKMANDKIDTVADEAT